jgi:hypothetical protein
LVDRRTPDSIIRVVIINPTDIRYVAVAWVGLDIETIIRPLVAQSHEFINIHIDNDTPSLAIAWVHQILKSVGSPVIISKQDHTHVSHTVVIPPALEASIDCSIVMHRANMKAI